MMCKCWYPFVYSPQSGISVHDWVRNATAEERRQASTTFPHANNRIDHISKIHGLRPRARIAP